MTYQLPELPYDYDALAPVIDARTMEIHHGKHHQGYVNKLNKALEGTEYEDQPLEELFSKVSELPVGIRNNGGGHFNHSLFWNILGPGETTNPGGKLAGAINDAFGSFAGFRDTFSKAAATRFGSGWAWLVANRDTGKLAVTSTPNQDNPLMDVAEVQGVPILGLDVWEHAYYLNYQNRRPDYIDGFWKVINWKAVEQNYQDAKG